MSLDKYVTITFDNDRFVEDVQAFVNKVSAHLERNSPVYLIVLQSFMEQYALLQENLTDKDRVTKSKEILIRYTTRYDAYLKTLPSSRDLN